LVRLLRTIPFDRLLQPFDRGGEFGEHLRRRPSRNLAIDAFDAEIAHGGGKPVLKVGVKAALRLAGLQIEEAENERAGKTEERRRKRNAHAVQRRGEAVFQVLEGGRGFAGNLQRLNDLADRSDGFQEAPEGAEEAEEDE